MYSFYRCSESYSVELTKTQNRFISSGNRKRENQQINSIDQNAFGRRHYQYNIFQWVIGVDAFVIMTKRISLLPSDSWLVICNLIFSISGLCIAEYSFLKLNISIERSECQTFVITIEIEYLSSKWDCIFRFTFQTVPIRMHSECLSNIERPKPIQNHQKWLKLNQSIKYIDLQYVCLSMYMQNRNYS